MNKLRTWYSELLSMKRLAGSNNYLSDRLADASAEIDKLDATLNEAWRDLRHCGEEESRRNTLLSEQAILDQAKCDRLTTQLLESQMRIDELEEQLAEADADLPLYSE